MPRFSPLVGLLLLPALASAQPLLTGTTTVVNSGPGDQLDPHVDCDLASYTDDQSGQLGIRYFNFLTGADAAIPTTGLSFLSDVNGARVVFTNVTAAGSQIAVFNTANASTFTVPNGTQRTNATLGGSLVAFEDRAFSADPSQSEIVAYDLATNTTTRLTSDALMDSDPVVSPSGNAVVFQKCLTTGLGCDLYVAAQVSPGTFSSSALTGSGGEETNPDTNGSVVVYESASPLGIDIAYVPITGGTPTTLAIPNTQRNPSVSGSLIAFESLTAAGDYDIFVYDISTSTLFRLTQTPVDETLNDITVCGGSARVVYSAPGAADFDVLAFTFTIPGAPPQCPEQTPAAACESPGPRLLLASLTVTRTTGEPDSASASFTATDDDGLVCVFNSRATSGRVGINGQSVLGPGAFQRGGSLIAREAHGMEVGQNQLVARIAGEPGASYTVKVYGEHPACDDDDSNGRADGDDSLAPRPPAPLADGAIRVAGDPVTAVGYYVRLVHDPDEALAWGAVGCAAGTGGLALSALALLGLWLMTRRQRAPARTRR